MRSRLIVLLLCAGALVLACGPRAHSNETPSHTSQQSDDGGQVLATSLNVSVERGVQFAFHVTNNSEKGVELRFPSSQTHDFVVLDSIGREVWRWAGDRMFTSAMQTKMLSARETMKVQENWDPAGKKGKFTVVARLTSGNHPLEEKAEFALP
jgi:intracellular proteinase inhibitor BsuPI